MSQQNVKMINLAHDIAKKKFGKTFPNPTVGCVIAKNSKIISKAVTNKSGRPHAEEIALAKAGGIGVIHRNLDIKKQLLEIKKVKKTKTNCWSSCRCSTK